MNAHSPPRQHTAGAPYVPVSSPRKSWQGRGDGEKLQLRRNGEKREKSEESGARSGGDEAVGTQEALSKCTSEAREQAGKEGEDAARGQGGRLRRPRAQEVTGLRGGLRSPRGQLGGVGCTGSGQRERIAGHTGGAPLRNYLFSSPRKSRMSSRKEENSEMQKQGEPRGGGGMRKWSAHSR